MRGMALFSGVDDEERIRRALLVIFAAIVVGGLPVDIYRAWEANNPLVANVLAGYLLITLAGLAHFVLTGGRRLFQTSQFLLLMAGAIFVHWYQGGFLASDGIFIWAALVPLGAAILCSWRETAGWLALFLAAGYALVMFEPSQAQPASVALPGTYFYLVLFVYFPGTVFALILYVLIRLERVRAELREKHERLVEEQRKSERLLLNILPSPIASRLKNGEEPIADGFSDVTVLFADLVRFTQFAAHVGPDRLVVLLNEVFTAFDEIADRLGIEKIKTIGDAYMAAAGLPEPRQDHAEAAARMALEMVEVIEAFNRRHGTDLAIRIGLNSGPVVAGVIGTHKFIYDLWGDTVNVASRMESHGTPNDIQISETVWEHIHQAFLCEERGEIPVKGRGPMRVFYLRGALPAERDGISPYEGAIALA